MRPVLVLPYLLTEIPQEEKSQEKGQPGRTTRGAPIAAQNAGDASDETGTYTGTVTMNAAGGKVSATFAA